MNTLDFIKQAHEYKKGKVCSTCKEHKPLREYGYRSKSKDGLMYECRSCIKEYDDNRCRFKKWFISKKSDARKKNIDFTIEPIDIPEVKIRETITIDRMNRKHKSWEGVEYPKVCPVLGIELDWGVSGKQQPNSPSLDRIDPTKGYIPGNVMIMSTLANKMKSDATPEQLKQFSRYHLFGVKSDKK